MSTSGLAPVNISLITPEVNPITMPYHTGTKSYQLLNKDCKIKICLCLEVFFFYFSLTEKRFGLTVGSFFFNGQYSHVFIVFVARGQE